MNTVINHVKQGFVPEVGDIYADENKVPCILARVERDKFCVISLADGNRYKDPEEDKCAAVAGLTFVARDAKIMINSSNGAQ
jgi:adenosine/AMP kinase